MTDYISRQLKEDMEKNAERDRIKSYKGEIVGPRTFSKPGIYTGAEMKRSWRKTMWDDVPSMMGGVRHYKCF